MQTAPSDVNFTYTCQPLKYNTKSAYPQCRSKHAACVHDGCLYLSAGKDGNISFRDLWRCPIDTWQWEKVSLRGDVKSHLEGHTLVSCKKLLLLFGGEFGDALTAASLWIINPDLGYARQSAPDPGCERPCIRRHHSAVVYDGSMFVYGGYVDIKGSSCELWQFSIDDEEWELLSPPQQTPHDTPGYRHGHTAVVYKKCMWMFGGMSGLNLRQDFWCYSFAANRWERVKFKYGPPHLMGHTAVVVQDKMLVFGGECNREPVNQLWAFSFLTEKWTQILLKDKIPSPRMFHTSVFVSTSPNADASVKASSMPVLQKKLNNLRLERPRSSPASASESQKRLCRDEHERQLEKSLSPKCLNTSTSQESLHHRPLPPQDVNLCINSVSCDNLKVLPAPSENTEDRSPLVPKKIDFNYNTVVPLDKHAIINGIDNPGVSHSTEELIRDNLQLHFSRVNDLELNCDTHMPSANFDRSVSHIDKQPYKPFIRQSSDAVMPVSSRYAESSAIGDHFSHFIDPSLCETSFRKIGAKKLKCDPDIFIEDLEYKDCLTQDIAIQYPSSHSAFRKFLSTETLLEIDSDDIESIELDDFLSRGHRDSPHGGEFSAKQRRELLYNSKSAAKSMSDIRQNAHEHTIIDNRRKVMLEEKSKLCDYTDTRDSQHVGDTNTAAINLDNRQKVYHYNDTRDSRHVDRTSSAAVNMAGNDGRHSYGVDGFGARDQDTETSFQSQCFPTSRPRPEQCRRERLPSKLGLTEGSYMLILGGKEVPGTNFSIKPLKMWKLEIKTC